MSGNSPVKRCSWCDKPAVAKGEDDTHDPTRDGTRCVYGYWSKA